MTAEQKARDMLDRMGVDDAQSFSAGDLVELANLIAARDGAAAMVAKFKAEVTAMGGYENRFVALPAGGVREYLDDLERLLKA
jgi:hypothetical protein